MWSGMQRIKANIQQEYIIRIQLQISWTLKIDLQIMLAFSVWSVKMRFVLSFDFAQYKWLHAVLSSSCFSSVNKFINEFFILCMFLLDVFRVHQFHLLLSLLRNN